MSNEIEERVRTQNLSTIVEGDVTQHEENRTTTEMEGVESRKEEGLIFDEQTEMINTTGVRVPFAGNLEEREWNMKNYFLIPVRLVSQAWKTTDSAGIVLYQNLNETIHTKFSRWKSLVEAYTYYRYRVRYRIEVNGTQFHAGKLIASTRPGLVATKDNTALAVRHVTLDASENTVAELETEWISCYDHLSSEQSSGASYFGLSVFNQLKTGTGASTTINYTIYAQLLDVQLSLPRPLVGSAQGLINITNVQNTGNAPVNVKGDAFDMHGLDMPSNVEDPTRMVRVGVSNPFMSEGRPPLDRMSMYPSSISVPTDYTFGNTIDETQINYLKRKWSRIATVKMTSSDTFGKLLTQGPASPMLRATGPSNTQGGGTLAWLSSFFCNWRGDLEYCVEVVSTNYHTGKVFFGINYSSFKVADFSSTGVDPTTYYGKVIELNAKEKCHSITVPFSHWNSWLDVAPNAANWSGSVPTASDATMQGPGYASNRFTIGEYFLTVINPLVVPAGVDTTIELNVLVRAADNFEFHRPGHNGVYSTGIAQIDTIGNKESTVNTKTPSPYIERPLSLRDLLKRSVMVDRSKLSIRVGDATNPINAGFGFKMINLDAVLQLHPWRTVCDAYAGFYGDLRVKIVVDFKPSSAELGNTLYVGLYNRPGARNDTNKTNLMACIGDQINNYLNPALAGMVDGGYPNMWYSMNGTNPALNGATLLSNQSGFDTQHVLTTVTPTLELEVPYYGLMKYKAHPTTLQHDRNFDAWGWIYFYQPGVKSVIADSTAAVVSTYISAGDGFRPGLFMGPSTITTQRQTIGTLAYYSGLIGVAETTQRNDDWEMTN